MKSCVDTWRMSMKICVGIWRSRMKNYVDDWKKRVENCVGGVSGGGCRAVGMSGGEWM